MHKALTASKPRARCTLGHRDRVAALVELLSQLFVDKALSQRR